MTARSPDYQAFVLDADGRVCGPNERMRAKMDAIPLPDLKGKNVLDVGCDYGFWSFLASNLGADKVLGIDRGRPVQGQYCDVVKANRELATHHSNLKNCYFEPMNAGKQWIECGAFDVIFLFSLYHHIFENCGDHRTIWFWLWRQLAEGGVLLWENPLDVSDGVVQANVGKEKHAFYTKDIILGAAAEYFKIEYVGPAKHETTRSVYRFTLKDRDCSRQSGLMEPGAGGATKAFQYAEGRRAHEIKRLLGFLPVPGSLNVKLDSAFDFGRDYYRAEILDVKVRAAGFESAWEPRPCRFYPLKINGFHAFAMRFEGEANYADNFVEIIAPVRLRDMIEGVKVTLERP